MKKFLLYSILPVFLLACDAQRSSNVENNPDIALNEWAVKELAADRWKKTELKGVTVLDFTEMAGNKIAAATTDGLYISEDEGLSWTKNGSETIGPYQVNCVEKCDEVLLAGVGGNGIYRSIDSGRTWVPANVGIRNNKGLIVKELYFGKNTVYAGTNRGLLVSLDKGMSWSAVNEGLSIVKSLGDSVARYTAINGVVEKNNKVILLTETGLAISNDGKHWVYPKHEGMTDVGMISSISVKEDVLYAGRFLKDGVYFSTDNGESWQKSGLDGYNLNKIYVSQSGILYAGTSGNGVFRSANYGKEWKQINQGLPKNATINTFLVTRSGKILAGTDNYGAFMLTK